MVPFDNNDLMRYYCMGYKEACKQLLGMFYAESFPTSEGKERFIEYCSKRIVDMDTEISKYEDILLERKRKEAAKDAMGGSE